MSIQTELYLPWPPSLHKLYGTNGRGKKYRTKDYERWRREAGWMLKLQKVEGMPGPVNVSLRLTAPDERKRDADNYEKAVLDLLVCLGVIDDDNSKVIRAKSSEWADDGYPGVHVTITAVETVEV